MRAACHARAHFTLPREVAAQQRARLDARSALYTQQNLFFLLFQHNGFAVLPCSSPAIDATHFIRFCRLLFGILAAFCSFIYFMNAARKSASRA